MRLKHLQHLYWRAGFGIGIDEMEHLKSKSRTEVISHLFEKATLNIPFSLDLSEFGDYFSLNYKALKLKHTKEEIIKLNQKSNKKVKELNAKWIARMSGPESNLREKMTLFWTNVFVCKDNHIFHTQRYNNTLRTHALGDFRAFVKAIAREPTMSKYLNNNRNSKQSPNENFARELMELFTLGIGNYTEKDIKEAARAFTGWNFSPDGSFLLRKKRHDYGEKTFLGQTGAFDGDDIIDIILEQKECARFICEKMYSYFINPRINQHHLNQMATIFYQDYNIETLMKFIFNSDWFYNSANIGAKIKSPIELLVGIQKIVPFKFNRQRQVYFLQKMMGQVLFYPINVAGWKGDKSWIDSNSLMFRLKLAAVLLNNAVINLEVKGAFEDSFEAYYKKQKNRRQFISTDKQWNDFDVHYGKMSPVALKRFLILSDIDDDTELLLGNLKVSNNRDYCVQLMSIPEYQLC